MRDYGEAFTGVTTVVADTQKVFGVVSSSPHDAMYISFFGSFGMIPGGAG